MVSLDVLGAPTNGTRTVSSLSAGNGLKSVENAVTGRRFDMKGMSARCATLMSLTLVRVLAIGLCVVFEDQGLLFWGEFAPEGGLFGRVVDGFELCLQLFRFLLVASRCDIGRNAGSG